jgi:hypothetical protein
MNKETKLIILVILVLGCTQKQQLRAVNTVDEIPKDYDIIFTSSTQLLYDKECSTGNTLKDDFITDADCNNHIYSSLQRQVYIMDLETRSVERITNDSCYHISAQAINNTTLLTNSICADTNSDGFVNANDHNELYYYYTKAKIMHCLTCNTGLTAVNNPDYSKVNKEIVFSAQYNTSFHNYLFTINEDKKLVQLTNDQDYMDFDCSWSEDGKLISFSRLPTQDFPWTQPSQVWIMNSDASNPTKITNGGDNPNGEENLNLYPIGIDADPDLSPDNTMIVFSRLRTGLENQPFGVYELMIKNLETGEEKILDSTVANLVPEWKSKGIILIRQVGMGDYADHPASIVQTIVYYDGENFNYLEEYPYNVFPIGAVSVSWI